MTARKREHRPTGARGVALRVLADLREGRRTAREAIDTLIERHQLPRAEAALAQEITFGVIRHHLTLARVIDHYARGRWKSINRRLQHILMMAAYQLIWLDGIPEFAAVHEAVEQAKAEGGARAGQFVNAVLRQMLRQIEDRRRPVADADARRSIPIDVDRICQFRDTIFPDPQRQPTEYLAETTSHPHWLVARWMNAFGREATERICRAGMLRPPVSLRPNRLRTTAGDLVERLGSEGIEASIAADGLAVVVEHAAGLTRTAAFHEGLFQPQDATAMLPVRAMSLRPGQVVLDLCAGLGTKTTQMAEAMDDRGTVLATDTADDKLAALRTNAARLGLHSIRIVPMTDLAATVGALDRLDWILLDVPCSNTGVLARRPEMRYRLSERGIRQIARRQLGLLEQAAALARPGTRLMYSTCSIDPAENGDVIQLFTQRCGWKPVSCELTLPAGGRGIDWHDGGFRAILEQPCSGGGSSAIA